VTETEISKKLTEILRKEHKAEILKLHGHGWQAPGWPDMYIVHQRFTGWLETKGKHTELSIKQVKVFKKLYEHGVYVIILRFITDRYWVLEDLDGVFDEFRFDTWKQGVDYLLDSLYVAIGERHGIRTD
jgi:hypothetical protein